MSAVKRVIDKALMMFRYKGMYQALFKEVQEQAPVNQVSRHLAKLLLSLEQDQIGISIEHLHPEVRSRAEKLLEACPNVKIISYLRTFKEQDKIYSIGRDDKETTVTNAKGGESYHNYGLAFDFMFKDDPHWEAPFARWKKVGDVGESLGLCWGGHFDDWGHFEYRPNFTYKDLKKYLKDEG